MRPSKTAKYIYQVMVQFAKTVRAIAGMVVVFVFMFVVISIFSFVLILVRIILNISLLKPLNPAGSEPFLMTTWYRPPQSSPDLFSTFERIIDKIDAENLELYLMGDLNCNLLSEVVSNNSSHLLNIIDIYGLTQLITEPTRVTQYSSTLIDLCLTNSPDKISKSGVINIGISDHSAISQVSQCKIKAGSLQT